MKKELTEAENNLKNESRNRNKIMEEVNIHLDSYSNKIIDYEKRISEYELMEIKYKSMEREYEDRIAIYERKCKALEEDNEALEDELVEVKKDRVNFNSKITALKTIVELSINEFGMDKITELSGINKERIEKYLQD